MKPILFNTEMVRAILDGRKSVTRRVIKPQPKMQLSYICMGHRHGKWTYPPPNCVEQSGWPEKYRRIDKLTAEDCNRYWTPPCHTDDILYVREAWNGNWSDHYIYKADGGSAKAAGYGEEPKWNPSIHMPKEAARLFLRVTGVRVERLQDISEEDAISEGIEKRSVPVINASGVLEYRIPGTNSVCISGRGAFSNLWNSTIKMDKLPVHGWDANPWVWVIKFERCERPKEE